MQNLCIRAITQAFPQDQNEMRSIDAQAICRIYIEHCRSPAVNAEPTSSTAANVTVTPPPAGPWAKYDVTVCPVAGPASECINVTCTNPTNCPVSGLDPGTTYVTTVGWAS